MEDTDQLQFAVDSRSEKIQQILSNNHAQACWYFRKTREQFRITGTLALIMAPSLMPESTPAQEALRSRLWNQISERSRALWYWPEPKSPRVDAAEYVVKISREEEVPDTFVLLLLHPCEVDHLELKGDEIYPQLRHLHIHRGSGQWVKYPVNP